MIGLLPIANLVVTFTTGGAMSIIIGGSSLVLSIRVLASSIGTEVT